MSTIRCFRAKEDSKFDKDIKAYYKSYPRWTNVLTRLAHLLGEELTGLATEPNDLRLDPKELKKEENRKLFKQNGMIKKNSKEAKKLFADYQDIVKDEGLANFMDLRNITFAYGTMRRQGQHLERFITSDGRIYFKADFDMINNYGNAKIILEEISQVEYEEVHLAELKQRKEQETS